MKIKDNWKIHIICGGLTLLFVLSTYIFYDETAGSMINYQIDLEYARIDKTQIDDTYNLIKEIDLSDFTDKTDLQKESFYVFEGDDEISSEAIIHFEDVSELIKIFIQSNHYLDESGEFNNCEALYISFEEDKLTNKDFVIKFNIKQNLDYDMNIFHIGSSDNANQPMELTGVIKIYERIGGEINE